MAFDGTLKFDTEIDDSGFSSGVEKIGSFAQKGMAAVAGAVTAASGAMVALGKSALEAYADYEQLTDGVETLFGDLSGTIRSFGEQALGELSDDLWEKLGEQVYANAGAFQDWENDVGSSMDAVADAMAYGIGTAAEDMDGFIKHLTDSYQMNAVDAQKMAEAVSAAIDSNITDLGDYASAMEAIPDAANMVLDNAGKAFASAGLSQNEYMETVTSFSAALIASLEGDTVKAAQVADMAIVDMADNANKMGSSMESIQNAYQGFAKQNYTMLDNLKLGYGGTKAEMERLLEDAETLSGIHYDLSSYSDIVEAIHVVQTEMHISGISAEEAAELVASGAKTEAEAFEMMGTTAKEASTTIQGSLGMAKAAWDNLVVGIADDEQDFGKLTDDFVESATAAASNILPRVEVIIGGMGKLVTSLSSAIADTLVDLTAYIPDLVGAGVSLIDSLMEGLVSNIPALADSAFNAGMQLLEGILTISPKLFELGVQLFASIIEGISTHIGDITEMARNLITELANTIAANAPALAMAAADVLQGLVATIGDSLPTIIEAVLSIITSLATAIIEAAPTICKAIINLIPILITTIISSIPKILNCITDIFMAVVEALPDMIVLLVENLPTIIVAIVEALIEAIPQILEAAGRMFMAIVDALPEIIVALVVGLGELLGKIGDFLKNILVAIVQWALEMREKARQAAKDFIDGAIEFFKELPGKIGEFLKNVIVSIIQWALEMREKARNAAKDFFDNIVEFFKELPGKIWESLTNTIKNVIAFGLELREKARNAASDMFHNIVDTIKELPSKMLEIGKNLVEGLWNGIKNMGQWIKDKITGFADGVIGGFKSVFGISSPSKVMRDSVGRYLAEGLGEGFMDELPSIAEEARKALTNLDISSPEISIGAIATPDIDVPRISAGMPYRAADDFQGSVAQSSIASDAIAAMAIQQVLVDRLNTTPSATSDIINNQYTYNTTSSSSTQASTEPQPISLTAQFVLGEEVVAEGVLDIIDDKIDERQGLKVQMKRRGVAT